MPQGTVPNSVPTPCIEALLTLASAVVPGWRKSLEASAIGEPRASLVPMANLLIMRGFTDREQGDRWFESTRPDQVPLRLAHIARQQSSAVDLGLITIQHAGR
jgi:hypothetical protein